MEKYNNLLNNIKKYNVNIDSIYIEEENKLCKLLDYNNLHELRSCSKLLISMAVGIAIEQKLLSLNEKIFPYLEKHIINSNNIDKIKKWTIRTLLTHTTGYDKMLMSNKDISENNIDKNTLLDYILNFNIVNEPNEKYIYNNVEPFIISVIFKEKLNIDLEDYIKKNIFDLLDIKLYKWDKYGQYCPGCTGLYLSPNDFHKLGKLILNGGKYNGVQVVPSKWISEICKLQIETPHLVKKERLFPKYGAGYFTFISRDGYIFRDGTNGQYIIINEDKNLIITVMSSEKEISKVTEIFRNILS